MANRLTSLFQTSEGSTSECYYIIDDFRVMKDGRAKAQVRYYLTQAHRVANINDHVRIAVNDNMREMYSLTLTDINSTISDAYAAIAALHKAEGHTVESDDSGSWVQV